jgi:hypothetical protein
MVAQDPNDPAIAGPSFKDYASAELFGNLFTRPPDAHALVADWRGDGLKLSSNRTQNGQMLIRSAVIRRVRRPAGGLTPN